MHFLNPQKNTFLYNFFGASTLGQSIFCSLLFCTDLSAKNGVRMIAYHNKKFIIEIWGRFWKPQIPIAYRTKSTVMPWPKAPLPYSCAHEQGRGHRRFCAISPVPDAFVKFSQWRRRRGRCCGASVGTTGSAPSARSRPRSVVRGLCWNHWFRPLWSITTPKTNEKTRQKYVYIPWGLNNSAKKGARNYLHKFMQISLLNGNSGLGKHPIS
jgi:hypothetical protein